MLPTLCCPPRQGAGPAAAPLLLRAPRSLMVASLRPSRNISRHRGQEAVAVKDFCACSPVNLRKSESQDSLSPSPLTHSPAPVVQLC